jgi:NitT/TauT family transport system ATP-binding protein
MSATGTIHTMLPFDLQNVSFAYQNQPPVFQDLTLCVSRGEFVVIVGPSGCGKTTLLGLLAGFLAPTNGTLTRQGTTRTIYQQGGLFPWRTIGENIALGVENLPEGDQQSHINAMLALVGMSEFADRYPHELSGGQRQRIELARALCGETDILLMDEPFSALDYLTRRKMRQELLGLLKERPRTVLLVTHDIEEAVQLADRVLVLSEKPARVQKEIALTLTHPRDITGAKEAQMVREILKEMGNL